MKLNQSKNINMPNNSLLFERQIIEFLINLIYDI
jgi:hypothetical protein